MKTPSEPSGLELQILSLLWAEGPLTARQVLERMPDGKPPAYTTILSVMQVMEKKRLLSRRPVGTANVYRPAVTRSAGARPDAGPAGEACVWRECRRGGAVPDPRHAHQSRRAQGNSTAY